MMEDLKRELRLEFLYAFFRGVGLTMGIGFVIASTALLWILARLIVGI